MLKPSTFPINMFVWCSWLSRLSNTQTVLGSSPSTNTPFRKCSIWVSFRPSKPENRVRVPALSLLPSWGLIFSISALNVGFLKSPVSGERWFEPLESTQSESAITIQVGLYVWSFHFFFSSFDVSECAFKVYHACRVYAMRWAIGWIQRRGYYPLSQKAQDGWTVRYAI